MTPVVAVVAAYAAVFIGIGGYIATLFFRRKKLMERAADLASRRT